MRLFARFDFAYANIACTLLNLAGFAMMLLVPFALARIPALPVQAAGAVLAASPAGTAIASSLAGRLAARHASAKLMLLGTLLAGLGLLGVIAAPENAACLAATMLIAGSGLGVFQVAYLEALTTAVAVEHRGVAGSLGMLTRTLGIVSGAAVIMLLFQAVQSAELERGLNPDDAFLAGFRAAFAVAGAISLVLATVFLLRFRGRE